MSAIAIYRHSRFPTWARFESVRVRNSVRPSHLFDHHCDQDSFYSNSLANRERDAQSLHRRRVFDRVKQTGVAISSDQLIPLQTSSMDVLSFRTHDRNT